MPSRISYARAAAMLGPVEPFLAAARKHYAANRFGSYLGNLYLAVGVMGRFNHAVGYEDYMLPHGTDPRVRKLHSSAEKGYTEALGYVQRLQEVLKYGLRTKKASGAREAIKQLNRVYTEGNEAGHKLYNAPEKERLHAQRAAVVETARSVDAWAASDAPGAVLLRKIKGKEITVVPSGFEVCHRCGGAGYFPQWSDIFEGRCFRCGGSGLEPTKGR